MTQEDPTPLLKPRFALPRNILPSGAVCAFDSNVFLHGSTEFSSNYAGDDGGKANTTRDISVMPPLVEQ